MKRKILPIILSFGIILILIIYPDKYLPVLTDGLKIFVVNVLPALLPFFFFTGVLSNLGTGEILGSTLNKPCKKLYNTSGIGGYVFVTGMLSGYPVSAKVISDLVKERKMTESDARTIMTYTSTSGPLFIVGSVGTMMLHNKTAGIIILFCHYLSALLNGLLYRKKGLKDSDKCMLVHKNVDNVLSECAYSAVISVLIAGIYVTIFYAVAHILTDLGVVKLIAKTLSIALDENVASGIAFGLIEMTGGCLMLSNCSSIFRLPAICAIISFGGLSVTLQSMTFLEKANVRPFRYILAKITQSIIAFLLTFCVVSLFSLV